MHLIYLVLTQRSFRPTENLCCFFTAYDLFSKILQAQKIVPETEWSSFLEALKRELPASFRISDCNEKESEALLNIVEGRFFKDLINPEDPEEQQKKPLCLPWYVWILICLLSFYVMKAVIKLF